MHEWLHAHTYIQLLYCFITCISVKMIIHQQDSSNSLCGTHTVNRSWFFLLALLYCLKIHFSLHINKRQMTLDAQPIEYAMLDALNCRENGGNKACQKHGSCSVNYLLDPQEISKNIDCKRYFVWEKEIRVRQIHLKLFKMYVMEIKRGRKPE